MLRPSSTALIALSLLAAVGLAGCKTIYSDTYSYRRNYFKPDKEKPKPTELLPESAPLEGAPAAAPAPAVPGLDAAPAPADPAAPAPAAPPAIPGL